VIELITGLPRAGKTMFAVKRILESLGQMRHVYTSVPVFPDLIRREVKRVYGFDAQTFLHQLPQEVATLRRFWELVPKDPCHILLDEVHTVFSSKASIGQTITGDAIAYFSQHGKWGHDVSLITQSPGMLDVTLRDRLTQRYWFAANANYRLIAGMRGGSGITLKLYDTWPPPKTEPAAATVRISKEERERLGQLYDTTAGVGVAGSLVPERPPKSRLIWPYIALVGGGLVAVMAWRAYASFGKMAPKARAGGSVGATNLPGKIDSPQSSAIVQRQPAQVAAGLMNAIGKTNGTGATRWTTGQWSGNWPMVRMSDRGKELWIWPDGSRLRVDGSSVDARYLNAQRNASR